MYSVSPVMDELHQKNERVIALDQPEYAPIIALPLDICIRGERPAREYSPSLMAVRFRLTDEERAAIAAGADLVLTESVFGSPFTPINIQFCKPDEAPQFS